MANNKGLYKRGDTWWIRYAGSDGKMKFESSKSAKKKEAEALLIQRKQEVLKCEDTAPVKVSDITLAEFAPKYLDWAERQRGIKGKRQVTNLLLKAFGNLPLKKFSTQLLEQYQTDLLNSGIAPATANRRLATLKHMYTKAVEWELLPEIVRDKVRKVKLLQENNRRLRYLSEEDCEALINACDSHLRPIVITALNTGMRRNEILSLEWDKHIDLKHGFILLDITKNGERREIPVNQTLRETLQELTRRLDIPYVFYNPFTNHRYVEIKDSFKAACKRAGIKDFNFHDLRHTFASQLVMGGVDLTTLRELLGHKTITMTLRYAHLAPSHKVKAVGILDRKVKTVVDLHQ